MAKYVDAEEIFFSYKEEEVAAQYNGKNDITSGVLFVLDTISEMPESIVRCKDCIHYYDGACLKIYSDGDVSKYAWQERKGDDFCSYGERRSE